MTRGELILSMICVLILGFVIMIFLLGSPNDTPACRKMFPTAGAIVDCIATRTAEAKSK